MRINNRCKKHPNTGCFFIGGTNMKTIIKRLDVRNARLYSISSGKRLQVADFQGMVEIVEHKTTVSILGQRYKGEKKVYASFLISDDIE